MQEEQPETMSAGEVGGVQLPIRSHMSYSLNSSKKGYVGDSMGKCHRA